MKIPTLEGLVLAVLVGITVGMAVAGEAFWAGWGAMCTMPALYALIEEVTGGRR